MQGIHNETTAPLPARFSRKAEPGTTPMRTHNHPGDACTMACMEHHHDVGAPGAGFAFGPDCNDACRYLVSGPRREA